MPRRTYTCETLRGTTKFKVEDVGGRYPAEAAEFFCEHLCENGELALCDGDSVDVIVTVDNKVRVKCNVIVSVETKVIRKFTGIDAGQAT